MSFASLHYARFLLCTWAIYPRGASRMKGRGSKSPKNEQNQTETCLHSNCFHARICSVPPFAQRLQCADGNEIKIETSITLATCAQIELSGGGIVHSRLPRSVSLALADRFRKRIKEQCSTDFGSEPPVEYTIDTMTILSWLFTLAADVAGAARYYILYLPSQSPSRSSAHPPPPLFLRFCTDEHDLRLPDKVEIAESEYFYSAPATSRHRTLSLSLPGALALSLENIFYNFFVCALRSFAHFLMMSERPRRRSRT